MIKNHFSVYFPRAGNRACVPKVLARDSWRWQLTRDPLENCSGQRWRWNQLNIILPVMDVADRQEYYSWIVWWCFVVRSILGLMEPLISTLKLAAQMVCIRQSELFKLWRVHKCLELPWMEYISSNFPSLLWVTTSLMGLHDLNILSLTCVVMQKTNPSSYPTMSQWSSSFSSPYYP